MFRNQQQDSRSECPLCTSAGPFCVHAQCVHVHACVHTCIFLSILKCVCGEGCMPVLIPCDCAVLIAALLVCLDWHQKWHRQTPDEEQSACHRLNNRLKYLYPVSLCLTHNTLVRFPVWLSVCIFLIEFKPLCMLPRYLKCLILFGKE